MKITAMILLCVLCAACSSGPTMKLSSPAVTIDTRMLEVLPDGTGWVILKQSSEEMERALASLRSRGVSVRQDFVCGFDVETQTVRFGDSTHQPAALFMYAVNIDDPNQELIKGFLQKRTQVTLTGDGIICGVAMFTDDRIDEHLARIFSAGKQIGLKLSCENVACD